MSQVIDLNEASLRVRPTPLFDCDVEVRPWTDPYLDAAGHDPRSSYVETYWLPVLGPSATWLLRRFAAHLEREPEGFTFDAGEWAQWLGVNLGSGRENSPFAKTLRRCMHFGAARLPREAKGKVSRQAIPSALEVRRKLPTLSVTQAQRLPEDLRETHRRAIENGKVKPVIEVMRERSRALALSLVRMGEEQPAVERQLTRWRFHPALSREAAQWAFENQRLEAESSAEAP